MFIAGPDPGAAPREGGGELADEEVGRLIVAARSGDQEGENALTDLVSRSSEDDGDPVAQLAADLPDDRFIAYPVTLQYLGNGDSGLGPDAATAVDRRG